jgi:hypothetical protein
MGNEYQPAGRLTLEQALATFIYRKHRDTGMLYVEPDDLDECAWCTIANAALEARGTAFKDCDACKRLGMIDGKQCEPCSGTGRFAQREGL